MTDTIKELKKSEILRLSSEISYQEGQMTKKLLAQNSAVRLVLLAFDKGGETGAHSSAGDALVSCIEGTGRIIIDSEQYELCAGESIVIPADHPHAIFAVEKFKMLLTVIF